MTQELKTLFAAIAKTKNELQLQETVIHHIGNYFTAKRYRLFLRDRLPQTVKKSFLLQLALSVDHNPVLKYVVENHIPVHEGVLLTKNKCKLFVRVSITVMLW